MPRYQRLARLAATLCLLTIGCGCTPDSKNSPLRPLTTEGNSAIAIGYRSEPDPPRSGRNTLEVSLKDANGAPLTDATVTAVFYMPAMPSMNMPEMSSTFVLEPQGEGLYRGSGELVMSGTWNVTVKVARGAEKIASSRFSVNAR